MCGFCGSFEGFFLVKVPCLGWQYTNPWGVKGFMWDVYIYTFMDFAICLLKFHRVFLNFFGNYFGFWNVFLGQKLALVVDMLKTLFEVSLDQPFGVLWGHRTGKWCGHGGGDDQTSMMSFVWEASTSQSMPIYAIFNKGFRWFQKVGSFFLEKTALRGEVLSGTWELFGCDV